MDEAKKLVVLEQENEELKRELRELFKTLDQMNQSLNRMIDHYILSVRRRRRDKRRNWIRWERRGSFIPDGASEQSNQKLNTKSNIKAA